LQEQYVSGQVEGDAGGPLIMNAFEMITLSQGLNLSALFDRQQVYFVSMRKTLIVSSNAETQWKL